MSEAAITCPWDEDGQDSSANKVVIHDEVEFKVLVVHFQDVEAQLRCGERFLIKYIS